MPSVYNKPANFAVGDYVRIDWNKDGHVTRHRIVQINHTALACKTGVMVKLDPLVQRVSWWIDAGWIESVEKI